MSYTQSGNFLQFFSPVIAIAGTSSKPLAAINIAAANATHGEFVCVVPCVLRQVQATVVLAVVNSSVTAKVTTKKYTLPGAGGTASTIQVLAIPDASTVGQTIYAKDLSTAFLPGQVIQVSWTVGTGGSVAGEVVYSAVCDYDPETYANSSLMVLSA